MFYTTTTTTTTTTNDDNRRNEANSRARNENLMEQAPGARAKRKSGACDPDGQRPILTNGK